MECMVPVGAINNSAGERFSSVPDLRGLVVWARLVQTAFDLKERVTVALAWNINCYSEVRV